MQTIINKSGPYLSVIVLAVMMAAFFQPTSANACCTRKGNFGCCGNGKCNILCCNCNGGCNKQCEATTCNTVEWLECGGIVVACIGACDLGVGSCELCMGTLFLKCVKCYSGKGTDCIEGAPFGAGGCPPPLQCIKSKCTYISDELEFPWPFPKPNEGEECQAAGVTERDNFFEGIANFDGESFTISRGDMRRFIRLEKKRTGMVLNAPFSEMFDAYDTDDNQLIDRGEFDNEEVDYYLMEPDDN